ncbi:MAG: MFS transporter [Bacteroidetes bacterium]|nr:MFS transporter [Bacteroidota bacterium]
MNEMHQKKSVSLWVLYGVFFFWGFVAASNTVLIGTFKTHFSLSQFQSQLVDMAFYAAYFLGSLLYFGYSQTKGDLLNKMGYKTGLLLGLLISALGCLGFIPAASMQSFPLMLSSLFVVAIGFTLQQIVVNPYVMALGSPETGAHRVTLGGGINSFGTTIGPIVISYAIFGGINNAHTLSSLSAVQMPYLVLAMAFVMVALWIGFSKLPAVVSATKIEKGLGALAFPQVKWGMLAIFIYVGVEVTIQSNMPALLENSDMLGLPASATVHFISLYWGSLMIGRWTGSISAFNVSQKTKRIATFLLPLMAYLVILSVNYLKFLALGTPEKIHDLLYYAPCIALVILGFYMAQEKPARTMWLFGSAGALLMLVGICSTGYWAVYSFISGGLFCSVMWPCIFSLSLAGLGTYTNQASSLLIMMILGGALIPPLQGLLSEKVGIHFSYVVPLVGFVYLAYFGIKVKKVLKQQGIDFDKTITTAH